MNQTRQPRGVPVGGQFAANDHDEAKPWESMTIDEHKGAVSQAILDTLADHGIYDWDVRFSQAYKTLGVAQFNTKQVRISVHQFQLGRAATMDTAMHEAAHVIAGIEAGHGEQWKAVARRLGANPRSTTTLGVARDQTTKTVKTRYGNVTAVEGETTFEYNGTTFTLTEARNTKVVGADANGKKFLFDADILHENYGDYSKMTHGRTKKVKTEYGIVEATEGKTTFMRRGKQYTVVEIANKNIVAIDSRGRRTRMRAEAMHEMDGMLSTEMIRASIRNAARRSGR